MYKDLTQINYEVTDLDAINDSIRNIILTARGTVPGNPRFGSDIYKILFAPLDPLTTSMATNYVKEALSEFEDRISVQEVSFKMIPEFNKLVIDVIFVYKDESFNTGSSTVTANTSLAINL